MITGKGITKTYRQRGGILGKRTVQALRGVDFAIEKGGAVSFIGESGCGKSTLGRIIAGLETYDSGEIIIDGVPMSALSRRRRWPYFRRIQLIHQDPYSALNPTRTIYQTLQAPLALRARRTRRPRSWVDERAEELLSLVGLDPGYVLPRYPHQLSGGMRQRVVIARALTVDPDVLVADEAVSMIDVSLRLGILDLLKDLRERLGVGVLFITHDIATARYLGENGELYVLYRGEVVERGPTEQVIARPVHPYTQALLSAVPVLRGREVASDQRVIPTEPLDERKAGTGCLFAPRCPFATDRCRSEHPTLARFEGSGQWHACFLPRPRSVIPVEVPG
ncbi:ABC transporter ATP-binding protein [Thermobispora bispora]|uniref:Oligopeptide/dipeptide ABC transporter, ATPase subunit n=1 Tax=Thermobispora bispora (strain ATCC 19993 / DSM 43833 / CBS 139.67 / JCM 10125 / KCTC 9307 / NBRC 14880 / R51) TaxID=469371 RepID=D6YB13_THEBD|nr:ABC transporter ATP-binding protein [Thermobispora bispora]ADG88373.1 oligopeptide/dipeptide ABC transporter, ATPase subunit [Thermobispora bispora DSM 43833]MBO2474983.1 ABC transporter ATP-binding protein [Actinomycetales bacterium]MDI9582143.1 ABC transporter ATP-binding protein [Thermobispora sp.]QSI48196.1 ABC transporter ATP-binding protein [Thermobispora bispora]